MVRFKNRYILASIEDIQSIEPLNQRFVLKLLKQAAEEMMGELFLSKITFSLQIKYMSLGRVLIRVPRDHCTQLQACLFIIKGLRIIQISGTIRNIQKKLFELVRKQLKRQLNTAEAELINKIDYS